MRPPSARGSTCRASSSPPSGLFALVYGFANAEMDGWGAPLTIGMLAYGVVAVAGVRRHRAPGRPRRCCRCGWSRDRNRGAAFLAVAVAGVAMFATFLFLTYYLQQSLGFSPIECGPGLPADGGRDLRHGSPPRRPSCCRASARGRWSRRGMALAALGLVYLTRDRGRLLLRGRGPARRSSSWASASA